MKATTSICVILVVLAVGNGASLLTDNGEEAAQRSGHRYNDGAQYYPEITVEEEVQKGDMLPNAYIFKILLFLLV